MTVTHTVPCDGECFESTMTDMQWPRLLCYWCKRSTINGGACSGDNWEAVREGEKAE